MKKNICLVQEIFETAIPKLIHCAALKSNLNVRNSVRFRFD